MMALQHGGKLDERTLEKLLHDVGTVPAKELLDKPKDSSCKALVV